MDKSRLACMLLPVVLAPFLQTGMSQEPDRDASTSQRAERMATLAVEVKDASGALIADASIKWANLETGLSAESRVDPTGTLTLALPYGSYELAVSSSGFRTTREELDLNESSSAALAVQLATFSVCGSCLEIINAADHLTLGQPSIEAKVEPSTGTLIQINLPAIKLRKHFSRL